MTLKVQKYLPIKIKEIKFLVNSYENWYNTFDKDGYKYVIEQLNFDDKYYDNLLSSLHNFVKGGNGALTKNKREMMFVQLLEGLSEGEAQCTLLAKDQVLNKKYKGLTANLIKEAFGWDENFVEIGNPGYGRQVGRQDLGRTQADIDYINRTGHQ